MTSSQANAYKVFDVSIHTPTKGVTLLFHKKIWIFTVSIHTPTKGVTPCTVAAWANVCCFNPHTHEGCDLMSQRLLCCAMSFNPHTHEGCDYLDLSHLRTHFVSIHTPTKGVTGSSPEARCRGIVSIHTPTKGVTALPGYALLTISFQSTHPRRV